MSEHWLPARRVKDVDRFEVLSTAPSESAGFAAMMSGEDGDRRSGVTGVNTGVRCEGKALEGWEATTGLVDGKAVDVAVDVDEG